MPDGLQVIPRSATSSRHAEQAGSSEHETHTKVVSADAGGSRHLARGKHRLGRGLGRHRHHGTSRIARRTPPTAIGHRGPKHLVQIKKRNV